MNQCNVILYSTGCPKCKVLKNKLSDIGIEFEEINDQKLMLDMGFSTVPVLEVDGEKMNFSEANKWINEISEG